MGNKLGYVKLSVSQSFTEVEVELLAQLMPLLLRGGSPTVLRRNPAFGNLCRKAGTMRKRLIGLRAERSLSSIQLSEEDR